MMGSSSRVSNIFQGLRERYAQAHAKRQRAEEHLEVLRTLTMCCDMTAEELAEVSACRRKTERQITVLRLEETHWEVCMGAETRPNMRTVFVPFPLNQITAQIVIRTRVAIFSKMYASAASLRPFPI
eukprot:TRINITY_DN96113_c0_g1_i1.p1 TRINITY_DN96113_c0_g1~~TRINITY_DN96113_c0_g1_i1.p1  ORF type:complete len:127 (+),score=11.43 TRINITY_DN96113_c0_g1_i1:70-450(+)